MKKFLICSLFLSLSLLTGCLKTNQNNETDEIKAIQNQNFEKKQECANYLSNIEKKLKNDDLELNSKLLKDNNTICESKLDEVFYSPYVNSCVYAYTKVCSSSINSMIVEYYIIDYLSQQNLFFKSKLGSEKNDVYVQFSDTINQLKSN
jgi:hypothetical protein